MISSKRLSLYIVFLFAYSFSADAAYIERFPITLTQPDSTVIHCFVSGDEFYNWVHDSSGYTLIRDSNTGYVVYAQLQNDELISTPYIVGSIDPATIGLQPWIIISAEKRQELRSQFLSKATSLSLSSVDADAVPTISNAGQNNGTINNIVIYIRFSGETEFAPKATIYDDMFNKDSANFSSMYRYFEEISYGKTHISTTFYPASVGSAIVSYQDIYPRSYYEPYHVSSNPNGYTGGDNGSVRTTREHGLLVRAVQSVRNQIPPNLPLDFNSDGRVDNICFIISGNPGAWGGLLWPHQWALYSDADSVYINNKRVYGFNFQIETHLDNSGASVLAHEMFHTLGAPDLYRYTNTSITPVGRWDLMSSNANPPQSSLAYMKYKYGGWIDSIPQITQSGIYSVNDVLSPTNNAYKIASPFSATEFFVIEYRNTTNYWDMSLPGSGLLIYRVNMLAPNGNADGGTTQGGSPVPDEIYIYRYNGINSTTNGTIDQAHFSSQVGRTVFNDTTSNPLCFLSNNFPGGIHIRNIGASGGATMSFEVVMPPPASRDTIAKWNSYTQANPHSSSIFTATAGLPVNNGIAILTRDSSGGDYAVYSDGIAASSHWQDATTTEKYWIANFSTVGYTNLFLTSKQRGTNSSPKDFKIQYKVGVNGNWTDVTNGAVVVEDDNYITGVKDSLPLPSAISNRSNVFLRWLCTSTLSIDSNTVDSSGVNRLDIVVAGETIPICTVFTSAGSNGTISPLGVHIAHFGSSPVYNFTPNAGYHLDSVFIDGAYDSTAVSTGSYTFTNISENHDIYASFARNTYTITATAGANGTISPSGSVALIHGANQTFTFTPDFGYHVDSIFIDGNFFSRGLGFCTFNGVSKNRSIHVTFAINTYAITATAGANGTITPNGNIVMIHGDNQMFFFTPDVNYHIDSVFIDNVYDSSAVTDGFYTFDTIVSNHTIYVSFAIDTFVISATAGANGTITPNGNTIIDYGDNQTFIFTPDVGYHIDSVFVDNVYDSAAVTDGFYTFDTITANHTIEVSFRMKTNITEYFTEKNIKIYPNPTTGQLTIDMSVDNGQLTMDNVEVFDILGRKAPPSPPKGGKSPLSFGEGSGVRLDISHLPVGFYFVKIGNFVEKIVKE